MRTANNKRPMPFAVKGLFSAFLALAVPPVTAATMPAVKMKVLEEHASTPIPGVVALFWGTAREGTITGHGGEHIVLFAQETVSDKSGTLLFPRQVFSGQPFFLNTNYENPSMLLLKPGYAPLVLYNQKRIEPTLADVSRWEYEGATVSMKKATDDELRRQAYLIANHTNMILGFKRGCTWKSAPRTLLTADRMFRNYGSSSTLRTLLMNDALFVQQGCGSPKAFFESYLRP